MKEDKEGERKSGLNIHVTISVGYDRVRPDVRGDLWEARVDSIGLLLVGALVIVIILIIILPHILSWLATL